MAKRSTVRCFPAKAEKLFPLKLDAGPKTDYTPEDFEYVDLTAAWGERQYQGQQKRFSNHGGFVVSWGMQGMGFGELAFRIVGGRLNKLGERTGARIVCDNEGMGKKFIKAALTRLVDQVELMG